ncbi:adenylyltransferase/sulfurtransferase [Natronospira proteinivora]|uniref:Adenylyltransferase/sulfurtransferase n=1 Tax=Natronospira proteinivora TaxID=1807133 RepID=A0ABT1G7T3_9GAMM|nr:molybdopterin-synthase adenylyltransferase MoeB [Natronospira proteinivora]MCP1727369.1 adenylyltransferase/sulfurtransferase [Natronospira proteinivora]
MDTIRYARHHALPGFGEAAQDRLGQARVLLLGAGGLGCATAAYLTASGVGELRIADFDTVDLANLQRQILYRSEQTGQDKVDAAMTHLSALNPEIRLIALRERMDEDSLRAQAAEVDLIVDGCDNFPTRFAANRAAVATGTPLVSGAAIRWQGQLAVFTPDTGCYACLFEETAVEEDMGNCAQNGVLSPLVGVVGSLQAVEAIKLLTGQGRHTAGRLLRYDAFSGEWRQSRFAKDPNCPVCGDPA